MWFITYYLSSAQRMHDEYHEWYFQERNTLEKIEDLRSYERN